MSLSASFLPTFGGILLDSMGVLQGFRVGLYFSFITHFTQSIFNAKYLREPSSDSAPTRIHKSDMNQFVTDLVASIRNNSRFQTILLGQSIQSFAQGLISQFTIIYAIQTIGLSKTEWGLISSSASFANLILRIPIGTAVDRIGNMKGYIIGIVMQSSYPILFYNSGFFSAILFCYVLNSLGGTFTQMGREALLVDIMPREERGMLLGSFAAISGQGGLSGSISPSLGAFLWDSYGPMYNFYLASAVGGFAALYYFKNSGWLRAR
jgi:MFS family permease